jgi:hypothetical protein
MVVMASVAFCGEDGYAKYIANGDAFVLGPTGIKGKGAKEEGTIDLFSVSEVEIGSPAHGLVREFDVITGVNGKPFPKKSDARINLGYAIIDSEAKDGKLSLQINRRGKPREVVIQLDRIPDYSPTWPFDCARTDTMLVNACDFLAREQLPSGQMPSDEGLIGENHSGLLWLAMGEPRYLKNAMRSAYWFSDYILKHERLGHTPGWGPWQCGYGALLLAEYYQMTGDRNILPALKAVCGFITRGQGSSGGWSHYFDGGNGVGYGEVNNTGMICYMALIMGKECGVEVDEERFRLAEKYYDRFAPALTSAYGDHNVSFDGYDTQNGKVGGLAVAHRLNGRQMESDGYALKSARSFNSIQSGHTGHFFNLLWTPSGASLAPAKDYRWGMDQIGWYYSLSRTWRGGFFCQPNPGGGSRNKKYSLYGQNMTTAGIALGLATPRRHLRILGAPESVFVVKLPSELEAARKLHQANRWDEAVAAVDAFLKKGGLDAETVRLANELRDKARYVKDGMGLAMAELDRMTTGNRLNVRAYESTLMVEPLKKIFGENDQRLKAMIERLPGRNRLIWQRGEQYYDAFRTLKQLRTETWFVYCGLVAKAFPQINMPFDNPVWTTIATPTDAAATCRTLVVPQASDAPKGWERAAFDDGGWVDPFSKTDTGKKKSSPKGYQLVRVGFDLQATPKSLRIAFVKKQPGLQDKGEVYLNGELVLKVETAAESGAVELFKETVNLLRPGRNVLAYGTSNEKGLPQLELQAELPVTADSFAWTKDPSRDAEIRKLASQRSTPRPYYVEKNDNRTVAEVMKAFQTAPTFMPEIDAALKRYAVLAPSVEEQSKNIAVLLKSPVWGARWTGLYLVQQARHPDDGSNSKSLPKEQQDAVQAGRQAVQAMRDAHKDQVIKLLKDPHPLVRKQAAVVVGGVFGASAKEAIPTLISMVKDFDGQTWWTRSDAWSALGKMPLDEATIEAVTRVGLTDPHASVRRNVLDRTFLGNDEAAKKAVKTYTKELIDQIFTIPHSMATRGKRIGMANIAIARLSKDELRPFLPRFFGALSDSGGSTLSGCMIILASFGEEVRPKLETMLDDKNEKLRNNALETLQQMAMTQNVPPETVTLVCSRLKEAKASDKGARGEWAKKLLKKLATKYEEAKDDTHGVKEEDDAGSGEAQVDGDGAASE